MSVYLSLFSSFGCELVVYSTLMASLADGFPAEISKAREGYVPVAELEGYMAKLRSITEGYGTFAYEFARYGHAPQNVVEKLSAEYQKNNG